MTATQQEHDNKRMIAMVGQAYGLGDRGPLLEVIDEDIVWTSNSPSEVFRFGGKHKGIAGIRELTSEMAVTYVFLQFELKESVAEGEIVWGLFAVDALNVPLSRRVKTDLAVRWRVVNGRVVEHTGFFDTAGVLVQEAK